MTDDLHMLWNVRYEDAEHELAGYEQVSTLMGIVDAELITRKERAPSHLARRGARSMGRPPWRETSRADDWWKYERFLMILKVTVMRQDDA